VYSRYPIWRDRFGAAGAMHLIRHEVAHLSAFKELCAAEGITEEMRKDHGDDNEMVKLCRVIDDQAQAEDFTQMKGALKAIVHPTGQV
jgi:hypothetical protein